MLLASPDAPVSILGMSPSPIMIVVGIVIGQGFFAWSRRRVEQKKTPLLALEVLDSPQERAATYCLFIIAALGPAINFLIPLYIQIVQGYSSLETAVAVIPYSLAIFAATALVVRLFDRWTPRQIGRIGFIVVAIGLVMLAFTIRNDWGTPLVILSLVVIGLGEGALLTLVFNVLVSASPKELAGDVGALRGTTNNLATGLGTAFASVLSVTLLSLIVVNSLVKSPVITAGSDSRNRSISIISTLSATNNWMRCWRKLISPPSKKRRWWKLMWPRASRRSRSHSWSLPVLPCWRSSRLGGCRTISPKKCQLRSRTKPSSPWR